MSTAMSEGKQIGGSVVRLLRADITELDVDAFVFYAQSDLALGSGFGTAMSVRGGPAIQQELEALAPVAAGEAVVSGAGKLTAKHIIHAVGPRFREADIEAKLHTTMGNCLKRAEENQIQRLAFPAMGAGYYGIAPDLCAKVMLGTIRDHLQGETGIKEVTICVVDTTQYNAFMAELR